MLDNLNRYHHVPLEETVLPLVRDTDYVDFRGLHLYLPRSFKATTALVGNAESDTAVCTSWVDPWGAVNEDDLKNISIAAPLRTVNGANIILANLALNPQINRIIISATGPYDDGEAAQIPREYLRAIFANGVNDDGTIPESSFRLPPELVRDGGINVIREIIQNVEIIGPVRDRDQVAELLSSSGRGVAYRESHQFPEFEITTPDTLPSERVNIVIREHDLPSAWLAMLDTLLRYGQDCQLETGGATVRELPFIRVVINNPESFEIPEWLAGIERLGYTPESLEKYYETKILPNTHMREIYPGVTKFYRPDGIKYLYAELLFAYPRDPEFDQAVYEMTESLGIEHTLQFLQSVERSSARADRNEIAESILVDPEVSDRQKAEVLMELFVPPVNQVQRILDQIRNMPDDADKTFFLWQPSVHGMRDRGRPCLVQGSLLVRDGRIDMKATFRSHDIPKGWIENIYGIRRFLMDIANTTGYEVGTLTVESESAHMYLADVEWANELVTREIRNKQPVKVYDAETMSDPRGNWQINVVDGQIRCVLQDQVGIPLLELEGRTAKDIIAQFRHFRLLSDPNHAMDLGAQLANAELANLVGPEFLPYIQDRSLNFRNIRNALKE